MALGFTKRKYYRTAGNQNSNGIALYNNEWVFNREDQTAPNEYHMPLFCGSTGTYDYYQTYTSSTLSLFGNVALTFAATGKTATTLNQNIYQKDAWNDDRLQVTRFDLYKIPYDTVGDFELVASQLTTPYLTYTASTATTRALATTGATISSGNYSYSIVFAPDQLAKPNEGFTEVVFEDRAQYFLNPVFTYFDQRSAFTQVFSSSGIDQRFRTVTYSALTSFTSKGITHKLQQGPWSGTQVQGLYFAAFNPPNKPKIENPLPTGGTFTPAFFFSNVEDGDEYLLEVEYASNATFSSSTNIQQYYFPKNLASQETVTEYDNSEASSTTARVQRTTTVRARRVEAALNPNQSYCWRIGNVKFIIDVFGIKRQVVTYSDINCAVTSSGNWSVSIDNEVSAERGTEGSGSSGAGVTVSQADESAVK